MKVLWSSLFSDEASKAVNALKALGDKQYGDSIPVANRVRIARVLNAVRKEREVFMDVFQPTLDKFIDKSWEWVKENAKGAAVKTKASEIPRPKTVLPMFEGDFNKAVDEILKHEAELDIAQVPLSVLNEAPSLTAGDFAMLDWLFVDDLDKPKTASEGGANRNERRANRAIRRKKNH